MSPRLSLLPFAFAFALASLAGAQAHAQATATVPSSPPPATQAPPVSPPPPDAPAPAAASDATAPPDAGVPPEAPPVAAAPPAASAPAPLEPPPATEPPTPPAPPPGFRELRATPSAKGGPGDPASVAAGPGGFSFASHDKKWQVRVRGLVQADGRFWVDASQRPQIDTFLIRRAQPYIEGAAPYGVSFLIGPDFGGGTTVLQDAYFGLDIAPWLRFRFGKFRPPFGLERLQPTSNLTFVEFGLPTLLTPNRDVGAMVHGDVFKGFFGYAAGVFNGVPDNSSGDLDTDAEKEFAGRAYFRPFAPLDTQAFGRLFVGVATTFGRVYGSPTTPALTNTPAYKTPGQITDFSYIAAATGADNTNTVVANGPHNRYGTYLYEALGPFSLLGEYYVSNQEVGRSGFPNTWVHNKAYQAQATFILFGANASYDFVHVETPVEPAEGHFGALELAARVGHLDIDSDVFPNFASRTASVRGATEVTLGANWYWSDNGKFVVNWDHTEFQGGARTAPELAIGHREAENLFLFRAQVLY
jgi:phosphate-selective porin OprO and OprP